jgi:hypothetical protein
MINNIHWKNIVVAALPTLVFYFASFALGFLLEKISPTGPCTPGLGVLWFLFLPFISFGLLIKNSLGWKGPNKVAATLHLIACIAFADLYFALVHR